MSGTSSSIKTKLWWNSHWMVLFQNGVRQLRSPAKMAATVQLRCYWKQLWSRWAITGSWEEPLVFFIFVLFWENPFLKNALSYCVISTIFDMVQEGKFQNLHFFLFLIQFYCNFFKWFSCWTKKLHLFFLKKGLKGGKILKFYTFARYMYFSSNFWCSFLFWIDCVESF